MTDQMLFDRPSRSHRVRRSFGFVDLSGFTSYAATHGDDLAVGQLSLFRSVVRAVGSATGVRVAKWLGDGAMLVGLEAAEVVSAIIRMKRTLAAEGSELLIHAGVACGDVILFEGDDHIGNVVNLAARLAELAQPGQILAPVDTLHGLARSGAVLGPMNIAGFDTPVEVADLALVPALVESHNL